MVALSVYVLAAIAVETVFSLKPETAAILRHVDTCICFIFIAEFCWRLARSPDRLAFLKWGWIDLVASIPLFPWLRWGRIVRIVRVVRILRGFRSARLLVRFFFEHRAKGAFASVAFISVVLVIFSAIAILNVETGEERNIRHAGDALWWAMSTITTVGYGDRYPVSAEGRIIGIALMIVGVGLFGTFTAYIASVMLGHDEQNENVVSAELQKMRIETELLRVEVARLAASLHSPGLERPAMISEYSLDGVDTKTKSRAEARDSDQKLETRN
jgi:voltage-gated potassium channel